MASGRGPWKRLSSSRESSCPSWIQFPESFPIQPSWIPTTLGCSCAAQKFWILQASSNGGSSSTSSLEHHWCICCVQCLYLLPCRTLSVSAVLQNPPTSERHACPHMAISGEYLYLPCRSFWLCDWMLWPQSSSSSSGYCNWFYPLSLDQLDSYYDKGRYSIMVLLGEIASRILHQLAPSLLAEPQIQPISSLSHPSESYKTFKSWQRKWSLFWWALERLLQATETGQSCQGQESQCLAGATWPGEVTRTREPSIVQSRCQLLLLGKCWWAPGQDKDHLWRGWTDLGCSVAATWVGNFWFLGHCAVNK